jgi:putative transcriptional regulator
MENELVDRAARNLKLKVSRIEKDFTQQDLADQVGVARQTIGLIENGHYNPSLDLCINIAVALDKTLNDLFWKEKDND